MVKIEFYTYGKGKKNKIFLAIMGFVYILVGLAIAMWGILSTVNNFERRSRMEKGEIVQVDALITRVSESSEEVGNSYIVYMEYEYEGENYFARDRVNTRQFEGCDYPVYVEKSNPAKYYVPKEMDKSIFLGFIVCPLVGAIFIVLGLALEIANARRKIE